MSCLPSELLSDDVSDVDHGCSTTSWWKNPETWHPGGRSPQIKTPVSCPQPSRVILIITVTTAHVQQQWPRNREKEMSSSVLQSSANNNTWLYMLPIHTLSAETWKLCCTTPPGRWGVKNEIKYRGRVAPIAAGVCSLAIPPSTARRLRPVR